MANVGEVSGPLDAHKSHWITLTHDGEIEKEEVYPRFATTWRGTDIIATVSCDRYRAGYDRDHQELTQWRVYAQEVRSKMSDDPYKYGAEVSDTARQRINDAVKPYAVAWLDSAEYHESFRRAIVHAIKRELSEKTYLVHVEKAQRWTTRWAGTLRNEDMRAITAACRAFTAYQSALDELGAD